jgi:protoporphyrinogen oxidase
MIATGTWSELGVRTTNVRLAVVGGGLLGMTLALRMRQRGHRVSLIESAPELGGLAAPWTVGDVRWDRHYHVTLLSDSWTRELLAELGLGAELRWSTPGTGFYIDGRMHPMNDLGDFLRFPPLGPIDKLRLGTTILRAARIRDGLPLEQIPVERWLTRLSGSNTFERIWEPLLRAKLGEQYPKASAAFIWAIIGRLYAAHSGGLGRQQFGYVPGGYARIVSAFTTRLAREGVEILLNSPVTRVAREGDGMRVTLGDGRSELYDNVVVTLPAPRAAALCDGLAEAERRTLENKRYQGVVCASVVLEKPLGPYYITNIADTGIPFSAVIDMSAIVNRKEFGGKALVYLPKYVAPNDALFDRCDESIRQSFLAGLRRMFPGFQPANVRAFRVSRVREVFPIATLGYSHSLPPIATSVPGLFLVNSAHIVNGTLNVNETVQLAERAFETIRTHVLA